MSGGFSSFPPANPAPLASEASGRETALIVFIATTHYPRIKNSSAVSIIPFIPFTCRGEVTEMRDEDGSLLEKAVQKEGQRGVHMCTSAPVH